VRVVARQPGHGDSETDKISESRNILQGLFCGGRIVHQVISDTAERISTIHESRLEGRLSLVCTYSSTRSIRNLPSKKELARWKL